jgi:hypothetical protein
MHIFMRSVFLGLIFGSLYTEFQEYTLINSYSIPIHYQQEYMQNGAPPPGGNKSIKLRAQGGLREDKKGVRCSKSACVCWRPR